MCIRDRVAGRLHGKGRTLWWIDRVAGGGNQVVHHVGLQQASHAVIREPLPHLGEEQDVQAQGMSEEVGLLRWWNVSGVCDDGDQSFAPGKPRDGSTNSRAALDAGACATK